MKVLSKSKIFASKIRNVVVTILNFNDTIAGKTS